MRRCRVGLLHRCLVHDIRHVDRSLRRLTGLSTGHPLARAAERRHACDGDCPAWRGVQVDIVRSRWPDDILRQTITIRRMFNPTALPANGIQRTLCRPCQRVAHICHRTVLLLQRPQLFTRQARQILTRHGRPTRIALPPPESGLR